MAQMVTLFSGRLRDDAIADYSVVAEEIEQRAREADGFVSFSSYTAADGERLSVAVFDSPESHARWRDDEEHREAQRRGRAEFYDGYDVLVCEVVRETHWTRAEGE